MSNLAIRSASRLQLWTEFALLFIGVPVLMVVYFEELRANRFLFPSIWILATVAAFLLWCTPGWRFAKLFQGPVLREWRLILLYIVGTAVTCVAFVLWLVPHRFLEMPLYRTELWLVIMIGYPLVSAWPQEIIFRSLFFERYGVLFPSDRIAIVMNGVIFGFGHMFFDSWVTIVMTGVGGAIMGWAYLRGRSMTVAWIMHAVAGQIIFTTGLGIFFYHGAVSP